MKLYKMIAAVFALILLLCSCSNNIINDNSTADLTDPIRKGNMETIRAQLNSDLLREYKNIKLSDANVGTGITMPAFDVKIAGNSDFDFTNTLDFLYGSVYDIHNKEFYSEHRKGDPIYTDYPATFEPTDYAGDGVRSPNSFAYDIKKFAPNNDDFTQSAYFYSMGNVWGSSIGLQQTPYYYFEDCSISETYHLLYDTVDNEKSYKMENGEQWKIKDAIEYVENFWNSYLSGSDTAAYTYTVKNLYVMTLNNDRYGYLFEMIRKDENGNFYDTDSSYIQDTESIEKNLPFMIHNKQVTWCTQKDVVTRFIKDFSFYPLNTTSTGDELLTLYGATEILSNALAVNINLNVESAELNYVVVCKGYPYFQTWENPYYYEDICLNTCEFEIKPYWCFRTPQNTIFDALSCQIFFVDAASGELTVMKY